MRVLIVAAVLAYAAAAPSGLLAPYGHGLVGHSGLALGHGGLAVAHAAPYAVAHAAPLAVAHAAPALPTISPGDIAGAAIDAHVDAHDHARAAVDAAREYHDQASEIQGQAVNAAEDHSWQAIDSVKTQEAQLDGAAAGVAPQLAKQLVGHVAPVAAYAGHGYAGHGYAGHGYAGHGIAGPAIAAQGYGVPAVAAYAGPGIATYAGAHAAYAPAVASSKTIVRQELSQTHPAPVVHAPVVHAPLAVAHAAPLAIGHGPVAYAHGHGAHGW